MNGEAPKATRLCGPADHFRDPCLEHLSGVFPREVLDAAFDTLLDALRQGLGLRAAVERVLRSAERATAGSDRLPSGGESPVAWARRTEAEAVVAYLRRRGRAGAEPPGQVVRQVTSDTLLNAAQEIEEGEHRKATISGANPAVDVVSVRMTSSPAADVEAARVAEMIERWEANVPPTPYDEDAADMDGAGWVMEVNRALRLAYQRGYGKALEHVRGAVERAAHREDPDQAQAMATPSR